MATERTTAPKTAIVSHDPRPFLTRAIDHGLAAGTFDPVDVDRLEVDVVSIAFRYLRHVRWDLRDLEAVRRATKITMMFVDDGLERLAAGDLDRAVAILADRPLSDCFRAGFGEMERLRKRFIEFRDGGARHIGPKSAGIRAFACSAVLIEGIQAQLVLDDAVLAERWCAGSPLRTITGAIAIRLGDAEQLTRAFHALPLAEVAQRWRALHDRYQYETAVEGTLDAAQMAWIGATVRATTRGDLGVVVRSDELESFLAAHTRGRELMYVDEAVVAEALSRLGALLARRLPDAEVIIRDAVWDAVAAIAAAESTYTGKGRAAWANYWAAVAFLELTPEDRKQVEEDERRHAPDREELVARFIHEARAERRERILDDLDVPQMPLDEVIELLVASASHAPLVLARVDWDRLRPEDIERCFGDRLDPVTEWDVAEAIVTRRRELRSLTEQTVFSCILLFASATPSLAKRAAALRQRLFMGWGRTPRELTEVFRAAENQDERTEWVAFAAESPEHLAYLITDALPHERALIHRVLERADEDDARLDAPAVVALFEHMEEVARKRRRAKRWGTPPDFLDADLRELWTHLPEHQQDAVRQVFTKHNRTPRTSSSRPVRRRKR